jgi:hypothetical protein
MSIKCLGKPTMPEDLYIHIITAVPPYNENPRLIKPENKAIEEPKEKTEVIIPGGRHLELCGKCYLPLKGKGEINKSENSCINAIRQSKKEPQLVCEIKHKGGIEKVDDLTFQRLWLYDGKIYEANRNDYDKKQAKLLILDLLDKEKNKFQKLKHKYESTKEVDSRDNQ